MDEHLKPAVEDFRSEETSYAYAKHRQDNQMNSSLGQRCIICVLTIRHDMHPKLLFLIQDESYRINSCICLDTYYDQLTNTNECGTCSGRKNSLFMFANSTVSQSYSSKRPIPHLVSISAATLPTPPMPLSQNHDKCEGLDKV